MGAFTRESTLISLQAECIVQRLIIEPTNQNMPSSQSRQAILLIITLNQTTSKSYVPR